MYKFLSGLAKLPAHIRLFSKVVCHKLFAGEIKVSRYVNEDCRNQAQSRWRILINHLFSKWQWYQYIRGLQGQEVRIRRQVQLKG
jgi:hypothetical protein